MALSIEQNEQNETVTIEGITYAQLLFRDLATVLPVGLPFAIVKRQDGVLTVQRVDSVTPTAWLHTVAQRGGEGEQDCALSFSPDNFPLQGEEVGMFYSVETPRPLYLHPTGTPAAFEFFNPATGHAIVDYSERTHVGHLTAEKGYVKRPLVYAGGIAELVPAGECTAPQCDCPPNTCIQRAPATFTRTDGVQASNESKENDRG